MEKNYLEKKKKSLIRARKRADRAIRRIDKVLPARLRNYRKYGN